MNTVEVLMVNFQIGNCVLGWTPVLYGGVPNWRIEGSEPKSKSYLPLQLTPDFANSFEQVQHYLFPIIHEKGFELFLSIQKEQTTCLLVSQKERFNVVASNPALAIALASLEMKGITISDVEEKWVDLYSA